MNSFLISFGFLLNSEKKENERVWNLKSLQLFYLSIQPFENDFLEWDNWKEILIEKKEMLNFLKKPLFSIDKISRKLNCPIFDRIFSSCAPQKNPDFCQIISKWNLEKFWENIGFKWKPKVPREKILPMFRWSTFWKKNWKMIEYCRKSKK